MLAPELIVNVLAPVLSLPLVNETPPPAEALPTVRLLPRLTPVALLTLNVWRLFDEKVPLFVIVAGADPLKTKVLAPSGLKLSVPLLAITCGVVPLKLIVTPAAAVLK